MPFRSAQPTGRSNLVFADSKPCSLVLSRCASGLSCDCILGTHGRRKRLADAPTRALSRRVPDLRATDLSQLLFSRSFVAPFEDAGRGISRCMGSPGSRGLV